jgi:hypothetical protein
MQGLRSIHLRVSVKSLVSPCMEKTSQAALCVRVEKERVEQSAVSEGDGSGVLEDETLS